MGDPGCIDRDSTWLRVMTGTLIGVISLMNAIAVIRLVAAITLGEAKFTNDANVLLASGAAVWLTSVIALRAVVLGPGSRRGGGPRAQNWLRARLRLPRDGQRPIRRARLVSEVP